MDKDEGKIMLDIMKHAVLAFVLATQMMMFTACTKLTHEPECTCECLSNHSHFTCGGVSEYHSTNIK